MPSGPYPLGSIGHRSGLSCAIKFPMSPDILIGVSKGVGVKRTSPATGKWLDPQWFLRYWWVTRDLEDSNCSISSVLKRTTRFEFEVYMGMWGLKFNIRKIYVFFINVKIVLQRRIWSEWSWRRTFAASSCDYVTIKTHVKKDNNDSHNLKLFIWVQNLGIGFLENLLVEFLGLFLPCS